ncbi:hypothetical protein B0H11DRAFT_1927241 [Mycena galericulata]|nr:hypothetical protein B0H11DRAFT_1927241 [Mycena galericulata]
MPKVSAKKSKSTSMKIPSMNAFRPTSLSVGNTGRKLQELEISYRTMGNSLVSSRGNDVAQILRMTPNLKKLTLGFSGHMNTYNDCLGASLTDALCLLTELEEFTHMAMTAKHTNMGFYTVLRIVSSWPKLRVLYISGDLHSNCDASSLPSVTSALQHVTLETCTGSFDDLARLLAGSTKSLKTLEAWTKGPGDIDAMLAPLLPVLESLKLGGYNHPSPPFVRDELGTAPRLHTLHMGGDTDRSGRLRAALTTALLTAESTSTRRKTKQSLLFRALKHLAYPASLEECLSKEDVDDGALCVNVGEEDLREVAIARGIVASRAQDLQYKGDCQMRKLAMERRNRRRTD